MSISQQPAPDTEPLRERKKQQTRQAIHEAALQLVDEKGLDGTTIEQICQLAGVSPRTFFNYYQSKAAAALGLPDHSISDDVIARFRQADGDLIPALCQVVGDPADQRMDRHHMKEIIAKRPELVPAFTQWMGSVREQFIQLALERAGSRDTATSAVTLVMAGFGLAMHDQTPKDGPAAQRLLEAVDKLVAVRDAPLAPLE
jgi:AcrR family transcriptional regulator